MSSAKEKPTQGQASLGRKAAHGALSTMGGQIVRLIIQFVGIVALARLLSPHDYGLIAMVMAIVGVGDLLRDFGLSAAAIQAKSLSSAQRDNLFWINTLIGFVLMVAVYAAASPLASFYGEPLLEKITQALSITFLLGGLSTQFRAHLNREFRMARLSVINILAQFVGLIAGITAAYMGSGYWALVIQQLVQASVMLVLLAFSARFIPAMPRRDVDMGNFLSFGWNLITTQVIVYFSRNMNSIVIGSRFGAEVLGFYDRAFQLLMLPLNQINAPATTVALPVLSRLQDDREKYSAFIIRGQAVLVHLVVAIFAYACAQAGLLIPLVLGMKWAGSASLFQILAIAGVFQAASYATYWVFLSKGLMRSNFLYTIISRVFLLGMILLGLNWGVYGVAVAYSVGLALLWPAGLWWVGRDSDAPVLAMFGNGLRAIIGYSVCGCMSYMSSWLLRDSSVYVRGGVGLLSMAFAFCVVCMAWPAFRRDVIAIASTRSLLGSR